MNGTKAEAVEARETEVDSETSVTVIEPPQTPDQMDMVIAISKKIEDFGKAVDTIHGAIIKRAFPGGWVCHWKPDVPEEEQVANMGAAEAERIALFLGIQETNWIGPIKEWSEDHKSYSYRTEADFSFGKRTIHVISSAGTKDKFFGYAYGQWKELEDVREDDIKKASFRGARKDGVRTLTGTRNIPLGKLKQLGLDISRVNIVGHSAKMSDTVKKTAGSDGLVWKEIKVSSINKKSESKDPKKPWTLWTVSDGKLTYSMFANPDSKRLQKLTLHEEDQTPVKVGIKVGTYNNQEQYSIERVEGAEEEAKP